MYDYDSDGSDTPKKAWQRHDKGLRRYPSKGNHHIMSHLLEIAIFAEVQGNTKVPTALPTPQP